MRDLYSVLASRFSIPQLKTYMRNRTIGVPRWDDMGLLCHSAGCDDTFRMIETNKINVKVGRVYYLPPMYFGVILSITPFIL